MDDQADLTAEKAVALVTAAFRDAERSQEKANADRAQLETAFIKACAVIAVGPTERSAINRCIGAAAAAGNNALDELANAHSWAFDLRERLIKENRLAPEIAPRSGGGKPWP